MSLDNLRVDDLERLAIELRMLTKHSGEWADRVGMPDAILQEIGTIGIKATMFNLKRAAQGSDLDDVDEDGNVKIEIDIGTIVGSCCVAAFILGFETHKQYGASDA